MIKVFIFGVLAYSIVGVDALSNINNFALFKQNIDRSPCHVLVNTHVTYSCHVAKVKCVVNGGIGGMKTYRLGCGAALHPPSFWLPTQKSGRNVGLRSPPP